ncbi:class I SAM-dependent methyltransferase [Jejuia spongiicola]|uniref:Methyltransferase domain-containing protein n=1 Tax=Jejuia spongiicola TaxID=2942207 RepID=A0ABT0QDV3_9FLAO|nr:methyltransferase domain-containing protein [Jejuia spongiicola]MCL6294424.1 methyltransferase domain-containing protein [Jejuia spongiicola]
MLSNIKKNKGVYYITKKQNVFSTTYIDVRKKEERVYTDEVVKLLPKITKTNRYFLEWKLRQKSTKRIIDYLISKNKPLKILDIGCGNGWFSNQLSLIKNTTIYALDINDIELEQAARVFQKSNLKFIYADIFASETDILQDFDIITVNSCIQYFENSEKTLNLLKRKLKLNGELHILDSPFYKSSEVQKAKERTEVYYKNLGVPKMINNYFHHRVESLIGFEVLYSPKKIITNKLLRKKDSPFMWLVFAKKN